MLDLTADKIDELHPDLAVIAAIGDDFSRARWWAKEVEWDGVKRWLLSTRKDDFDDYHLAIDQLLVVPEATRQWCEEELVRTDAENPTLKKTNRQFARIELKLESVRKAVPLLSWNHSFLYKRLSTGTPDMLPDGNMPRVLIMAFRSHERYGADT